jgi:hypothetical protein
MPQTLRIQLKSCPRCHGDRFPEQDGQSWELVCLQCGYRQTVSLVSVLRATRPAAMAELAGASHREVPTAA